MTDRIPTANLRTLLALTTPGPWFAFRSITSGMTVQAAPRWLFVACSDVPTLADDARLAALAPSLAKEVLALRTEAESLRRKYDDVAGRLAAESRRAVGWWRALDAIARANEPRGSCTSECASNNVEDADCDCGYVEASDDVGAFARDAIRGPK